MMAAPALTTAAARAGLAPWALFAGVIAAAGLPIYIHAPKFYVDTYGVGLGALGVMLFALRLIDVVQDPLLGWLSERAVAWRGALVAGSILLMAVSMVGLFAVTPPIAPLWWFALVLTVLFSAFSFLTITFYAEGVRKAVELGEGGHVRLAGWRETGSLVGVSLAALAPTVLGFVMAEPFAGFALGFAVAALAAGWAMRREWSVRAVAPGGTAVAGFRTVLADGLARRLLWLALINALPVAVTSTLFLFFVESRLGAPELAGPYLLLFFLSAAVTSGGWSALALRHGARRVLLAGMGLAIVSFVFAAGLGTGDLWAFAAICVASGAALGADMTLLPAMFARRMAVIAPGAALGFGLWGLVSKLSLALAAATVLPLLQAAGFVSGQTNGPEALWALTLAYAVVPCVLKLAALALLAATPMSEEGR
jgi:GPH family glycoside/pentoside/hexuronide:cation symporter